MLNFVGKPSIMEPESEDETHLVRKQMHEYAGESSIHGLKYVGEKERTTIERWVGLKLEDIIIQA